MDKPRVLISESLLSHVASVESQHQSGLLNTNLLSEYFQLLPVHHAMQQVLIHDNNAQTCIELPGADGQTTLMQLDLEKICGYVMYPSDETGASTREQNLTKPGTPPSINVQALQFMRHFPSIPVETPTRLKSSYQIRENFFERVFVLSRWLNLIKTGLNADHLVKFHARHKLAIMAHADTRDLGQLIAQLKKNNVQSIAGEYIKLLMNTLAAEATVSSHVNVIQHIQGYLKKQLSADEKTELAELIEGYRHGEVSRLAPVTLLKHFFRKHPDPYILNSTYLDPVPFALTVFEQSA
ncbi:MAG: YbgA family protein [Gammaproteobacteria bacterium]|nr:YbgA family protein [Gammaproteobacteria bacterium]